MQITLGRAGLTQTHQAPFPPQTDCVHCGKQARIAFVAHERTDKGPRPGTATPCPEWVCDLHPNDPKGEGFWLHDCCAVAVYFCPACLQPTALYNQG